MKRRFKISYGLIIILILMLGFYVIWGGSVRFLGEWSTQVGQSIQARAEEDMLPNLTFGVSGEFQSPIQWFTNSAMQIMPIGSYVNQLSGERSQSEDEITLNMIREQQARDENEVDENGKLVNEASAESVESTSVKPVEASLDQLKDFDYLVSNFYTVDSVTMINPADLPVEDMLNRDMHLNQESEGPKVLIFNTHSQETFVDSNGGDPGTSIVGVGERLTQLLNEEYGIETIHHKGVYDLINGKLDRSKAYDLAQPEIEAILAQYPSIEVVIDLHRDGVKEDTHLVTEVNGKPTAKIMFFNGMCRTRANGDFAQFNNPNIKDNLAFSLQMQLSVNERYPGFTRRIYLKGYRYNMHLMPKMLLIEAGAQTNTVEEVKNAMEPLAETLHNVLTE